MAKKPDDDKDPGAQIRIADKLMHLRGKGEEWLTDKHGNVRAKFMHGNVVNPVAPGAKPNPESTAPSFAPASSPKPVVKPAKPRANPAAVQAALAAVSPKGVKKTAEDDQYVAMSDEAAKSDFGDAPSRRMGGHTTTSGTEVTTHDYSRHFPELKRSGINITVEHHRSKAGESNLVARAHDGQTNIGNVEGGTHFKPGKGHGVQAMMHDTLRVDHAGLDAGYHGQGIGKAMYEALYHHAAKEGFKKVTGDWHTKKAHNVHEALARDHGFKVEEAANPRGADVGAMERENMPPSTHKPPYKYRIAKSQSKGMAVLEIAKDIVAKTAMVGHSAGLSAPGSLTGGTALVKESLIGSTYDKEKEKDRDKGFLDTVPPKVRPIFEKVMVDEPLAKPWSSDAQRRWGHTEAGKEALGGEAAVHEWDESTKGKKLPEKVGKSLRALRDKARGGK